MTLHEIKEPYLLLDGDTQSPTFESTWELVWQLKHTLCTRPGRHHLVPRGQLGWFGEGLGRQPILL